MTKQEFDSLYLGKVVHCDTLEKAKHFVELAISLGYNWYLEDDIINIYFEDISFRIDTELACILYAHKNMYINYSTYQVVEYDMKI